MSKDNKKNLYSLMDNTYKYSCPYRDSNYHTINNGVNCICTQYKNNNKYNGTTLMGSSGTTFTGSSGTTLTGSSGTTLTGSSGTRPQNQNEKVFINVKK